MPRQSRRPSAEIACRYVVTVSDLHVGSSVAIAPPALATQDGQRLRLTLLQEWLWHAWRTVWRRVNAITVGRYLRAMRCSGVIEYVRRIGDTTRYIRLRGRDDHGYGSATARGTGRAAGGRQRERRGAPRRPPR